jgi:ABC-type sulfate transport system substrate-binding protein
MKLLVRCLRDRDWRCRTGAALGVTLLLAVIVYGRFAWAKGPVSVRLVVYAFSTEEEALTQAILPAFEQAWEAETGRELTIEGVFGPSATLAGQINLGAPADVALFSNAQHVTHLKVGRRVKEDNQPVVVSRTPMVIVTRPGTQPAISGFSDLARPGLQLLHADPLSSGAGQWAVLAEYGSALLESKDQQAAEAQLQAIWNNVRLLGASARATLTLFELGAGDAFVTYENDALLAQQRGIPLEIVVPSRTIVAQHVAVIVDGNVTVAERPVAQAFLDYLCGEAGQQALIRYHLRPAGPQADLFPEVSQSFTVDDLGGWSQAYTEVVERLWQTQIEPRLTLEAAPRLLDTGE